MLLMLLRVRVAGGHALLQRAPFGGSDRASAIRQRRALVGAAEVERLRGRHTRSRSRPCGACTRCRSLSFSSIPRACEQAACVRLFAL